MQGILAWFFVVTPTGSRFYFIKILFLNICNDFAEFSITLVLMEITKFP